MEDFFSFDLNFKRICFAVVASFFIIALLCFVSWSLYFYFPRQQMIKQAKEFYIKKGLPIPENILHPEEF